MPCSSLPAASVRVVSAGVSATASWRGLEMVRRLPTGATSMRGRGASLVLLRVVATAETWRPLEPWRHCVVVAPPKSFITSARHVTVALLRQVTAMLALLPVSVAVLLVALVRRSVVVILPSSAVPMMAARVMVVVLLLRLLLVLVLLMLLRRMLLPRRVVLPRQLLRLLLSLLLLLLGGELVTRRILGQVLGLGGQRLRPEVIVVERVNG
mmetsp:Transcript_23927/g.51592  ORF Transcript_23927/g.51592 Transcript_23927/m.51592 type:complete len:211 (-) Transcript_23927:1030-1662(-)